MTIEQLAWARKHDWFIGALRMNGIIVVRVFDGYDSQPKHFADFKHLKKWAGY